MRVEQGQRRGRGRPYGRGRAAGFAASARRLAAAGLTLAVLPLALAGCGSSGSTGSNADPAGLVPAYAPVYVSAVVRPNGNLKQEALAAGHTLTGQKNPYTRLLSVLQTPGSPVLDFSRDVAPWLGENAGLFFTALGSTEGLTGLLQQGLTGVGGSGTEWPFAAGEGAQGAIVLDTSDLAKAEKFVSTQAAHAGAHTTSYKGVSFQATAGGDAFATIDKLVVLGSEAGVRAVIDTTQSGSSLKGSATYTQLQSVAPAGALGHVFANPGALTKAHIAKAASGASGETEGGGSLPTLLSALGGSRPLNVSLVPSAKSLAIDADIGAAPAGAAKASGGLVGALASGNKALVELPDEAWLAAGLGNVNGSLGGGLGGLHNLLSLVSTLTSQASAGPTAPSAAQVTLSIPGILEGILAPLKVLSANTAQARRDFTSWMGDVGVFAKGTTILELQAAAVIDSTDPAASRAAVGKLATALNEAGAEATPATIPGTEAAIEAKVQGLPVTLVIADGRSASGQAKFVMGLGESSITAALNPSSTMSGSAAYTAAQSALGEGIAPSLAVNFATLLSLLEGVGLSEDPTISKFVPYLRNATTLAGGGKNLGGGIERLRFVLGLLQPTSSG
jgi:hypothetical protein